MKTILLIFFLAMNPIYGSSQTVNDLLQRGLELEESGQYEQALEVWRSAYTELEIPSLAIGREYIRLATKQNLRSHYETASSIYLWGLTAEKIEPNRLALEQELSMLEPLTNRQTVRDWRKLLEENDPALYDMLLAFWQRLNPTPASPLYNERLLEHWERIAYSRENFNRRSNPPYLTDDRGPVYVRYGQPDRQRTGNLYVTRGQAISLSQTLDPHANSDAMADILMDLDLNPYFEIWVYDKPDEELQYNLVKIFGDNPRGGFGQVQTVEDFIPSQAFTFDQNRHGVFSASARAEGPPGVSLNPGMIFQWYYYQQLMPVDYFFAHQFTNMEHEWDAAEIQFREIAPPTIGKYSGRVQMQRHQSLTIDNLNRAPTEISSYSKVFPDIPIQTYHYRFLDDQNRPIAAVFLESQPRRAFIEDLGFNEAALYSDEAVDAEQAFANYELTHGLQLLSSDSEIVRQLDLPSELILDFQEDFPSSAVFTVPYTVADRDLVLYAELHNRHPATQPRLRGTPFPASLRGLGKMESRLPEPLSFEPGQLQMADLVLGWDMRHDSPPGTLFPFVVANSKEIPQGEELALHVEIYNLHTGIDGLASFMIDYEVAAERRRFEWLRGRKQEVSITVEQEITSDRFIENLEIRTRELEPGRYRLRLITTDNSNGQRVLREVGFRVVESGNSGSLSSR
jgi:GWxTD domain-containing protein